MAEHTKGPWEVYPAPITSRADAIMELIEQAQATDSIASHIYLLNADGKCPAITGFGPKSEANAARIVACVNALEGLNPDAVRDVVRALEQIKTMRMVTDGGSISECRAIAARALASLEGGAS